MTFKELFDRCIAAGMEADYRGKQGVLRVLEANRARYRALSSAEKRGFDRERLHIPYGDVRIQCGDLDRRIGRILTAINIDAPQVLEAKRLNDQGWAIDLLFSHHLKSQTFFAALPDYEEVDASSLSEFFDLPRGVARRFQRLTERWSAERAARRDAATLARLKQGQDIATLWQFCLCSIHTPCDNHLFWAIHELIGNGRPRTLDDFVEMAYHIPEYQRARREHRMQVEIVAGEPGRPLGRAWNANTQALIVMLRDEVVAELKQCGFDSIVGVIGGAGGSIAQACRKHGLNAVNLPHDPSDNLGINLLLDKLLAQDPDLDILCAETFYRVDPEARQPW